VGDGGYGVLRRAGSYIWKGGDGLADLEVLLVACVRPTNDHYTAAKRVMQYPAGTIEVGMVFGPSHLHDGTLQAYSDSSWHDDMDNDKSTAGYLFKLANGPFS